MYKRGTAKVDADKDTDVNANANRNRTKNIIYFVKFRRGHATV